MSDLHNYAYFKQWADKYFIEGKRTDKMLSRREAYVDYIISLRTNSLCPFHKFRENLERYVSESDKIAEINPKEFCDPAGYIYREIVRTESCFYLRTKKEQENINRTLFGKEHLEPQGDDYFEMVVNEMLNIYRPVNEGERADVEYSSKELIEMFSENVKISPTDLSARLIKRGFTLRLKEGCPRWQMKFSAIGNNHFYDFREWADYFFIFFKRVDCFLPIKEVFDDFQSSVKAGPFYSLKKFMKELKEYAEISPNIAELNPKEFLDAKGRILRFNLKSEVRECIYLRSK